MLTEQQIQQAAQSLWRAEQTREWTDPISKVFPDANVNDAYRIGLAVRNLKLAKGRTVKGHKIGLTSKAMRDLTGSKEPDYGFIFDNWFTLEGETVQRDSMNRPLVEVELAFVMGQELRGPSVNAADVIRATDFVLPALEVVDTRYNGRGTNLLVDSISDAASCGFVVLGGNPVKLMDVDVRRLSASLSINGQIVESGSASAVMGNPINAVVWLANKLLKFDVAMQPGDVILSGSFVKAIPFNAGDTIVALYDQLGEIMLEGSLKMIDLSGKIAFVTGGGSGIGDAVVRQFIRLGAKVGVAGRRAAVLKKLADECGALPLACDVSNAGAVAEAIGALVARHGALDIIVNSAGIAHRGTAEEVSLEDWQRVLDVNLTGALNVCKRGLPEMKKRGGGSIVNVASVGALTAASSAVAYSASKAGMLGLSRSMARDYGKHKIRVNTVCPGWVDTPMIEGALNALSQIHGVTRDGAKQILSRWAPLGRMAEPVEVANCISFLASPAASFVTGAVLVADGGQSIVDLGLLPLDPDAGIR